MESLCVQSKTEKDKECKERRVKEREGERMRERERGGERERKRGRGRETNTMYCILGEGGKRKGVI